MYVKENMSYDQALCSLTIMLRSPSQEQYATSLTVLPYLRSIVYSEDIFMNAFVASLLVQESLG